MASADDGIRGRPVSEVSVADDLAWWRAHRETANAQDPAVQERLDRLKAWKLRHDQDRERQPGPFLKLAWDAVFGDEDERVSSAIREIESAGG